MGARGRLKGRNARCCPWSQADSSLHLGRQAAAQDLARRCACLRANGRTALRTQVRPPEEPGPDSGDRIKSLTGWADGIGVLKPGLWHYLGEWGESLVAAGDGGPRE